MAYVAPSNKATSDLVTAAHWNQDVVANVAWLKANTNNPPYGARATNTAAIAIAHGTWVNLTFDTDRWDVGACHSVSSNTHRFTAPATGYYLAIANISWVGNIATDWRGLRIINGSGIVQGYSMMTVSDLAQEPAQIVTCVAYLTGTQYLYAQAFHDIGGSRDVTKNQAWSPEFTFHKIMT